MIAALLLLAISLPSGLTEYHSDVTSRQVRWRWQAAGATLTCGYVEWGTVSGTYPNRTLMPCPAAGFSTADRAAIVSELSPSTTYFYRIHQCGTTSNSTGCTAAEEAGSPTAEFSFTTPADTDITPTLPTLYQPARPTVNGSTLTATCGTLAAQLTAAAALNTALVHEVVIDAGTECAIDVNGLQIPAKSGAGWVIVRSSAAGTSAFPPAGTRISATDPGFVTLRCENSAAQSDRCITFTGTSQGWYFHGIKVLMVTEPHWQRTITNVVQGAGSQCDGRAADTWTITLSAAHGLVYAGQIMVLNGVGGFTSTPIIASVYSLPTSTSMILCTAGATLAGSYTSGGTITNYGGLTISTAVSSAGTSTITVPSAHGMSDGTWVTIQGGPSGLPGTYQITRTGETTFTVPATHGTYTSGAVVSYGPNFSISGVQGSENTSRIVFEQSYIGCEFPDRCLYPYYTNGAKSAYIVDSQIRRSGWAHRTGGTSATQFDFLAGAYPNGKGNTNFGEGGACVEGSTSGPLTVNNTQCVGHGILFFMQEGRALLSSYPNGPNSDIALLNSDFRYDLRGNPSSSSYTGLYLANRHGFECKACRRVLIRGNRFGDQHKTGENVNAADWATFTPRCGTGGSSCVLSQNVISDITIERNWFGPVPGGINLTGMETQSNGTPPPLARVRIAGNIFERLDGARTEVTRGFGHLLRLWNVDGVTVEGNSIIGRSGGSFPSMLLNFYQRSSRVHVRRNILVQSHDSSRGGFSEDLTIQGTPTVTTAMPGKFASQFPASGWAQNIVVPQVLDSTTGANCWASTAGGCLFDGVSYWSGFAGTTLVSGANADARIAAVGWLADGRVAHTSAYAGYGAAIEPILDGLGAARAIGASVSGSTVTVRWYAPSSTLCAVDRSNDSFTTWTRATGTAGTLSRAQSASFTIVPSGTWAIRINCAVATSANSVVVP